MVNFSKKEESNFKNATRQTKLSKARIENIIQIWRSVETI